MDGTTTINVELHEEGGEYSGRISATMPSGARIGGSIEEVPRDVLPGTLEEALRAVGTQLAGYALGGTTPEEAAQLAQEAKGRAAGVAGISDDELKGTARDIGPVADGGEYPNLKGGA
jgi:uncharacterized protein YbjT (DUF2867 family)